MYQALEIHTEHETWKIYKNTGHLRCSVGIRMKNEGQELSVFLKSLSSPLLYSQY